MLKKHKKTSTPCTEKKYWGFGVPVLRQKLEISTFFYLFKNIQSFMDWLWQTSNSGTITETLGKHTVKFIVFFIPQPVGGGVWSTCLCTYYGTKLKILYTPRTNSYN